MTGPNTGTGPTKKEAEAPKPSTEQAPPAGAKLGGGVDAIGRDATQVAKDLTRQGVSPAAATASGHAAAGSPASTADKSEHKGGPGASDAQPDAVQPGAGPVGKQQEAAFFTANGSIDGNTIPSPTGPVPAGLIPDEKLREQAIKQAREGAVDPHAGHSTGRYRLSEEAVHGMSPAQLRAVAHDRGYTDVEGGRRAVQAKFLAAQAEDDSLVDPPEGHRLGSGQNTGATTGVPTAALASTGTISSPAGPTPAVGAVAGSPVSGAQSEAQAKGIASTHNTTDGKPVGGAK